MNVVSGSLEMFMNIFENGGTPYIPQTLNKPKNNPETQTPYMPQPKYDRPPPSWGANAMII